MSKDTLKEIKIDGSKIKVAIVLPYFNEKFGLTMLENCYQTLVENKVKKANVSITRVAGCLEIPYTCLKIIKSKKVDVLIALGIIIKGETKHFDLVAQTTHSGLMQLQLENDTPIIFGILTCDNIAQVKKRVSPKELNKGKDFALSALIQANIRI